MTTIGIIGSGNVAWHLAHGLKAVKEIQISWIYSRNTETLKELTSSIGVNSVSSPLEITADLVLICVNDDSIQDVLNQLPKHIPVAYTSGTVSIDQLQFNQEKYGVFYPLQTFTKARPIDFREIPFLIESHNEGFQEQLVSLAEKLSTDVRLINSDERKLLHIAAVFVNNFTNHLFYLADDFLQNKELDISVLYPLMKETVAKATAMNPLDAQSGPARRADQKTIEAHLSNLEGTPKDIYALISQSILKTYNK